MLRILALSLLCVSLAQGAERESRPGVYRGYSEARFSEWTVTSQYVAVRDGMRLAVDIYRPAAQGRAVEGRFPVIWTHTPYRRAYIAPDGKKVSAVERQGLLEILKHGYVVAAVDTRGRGASFGARRGFQDRTEARDAYDMTEWLAAQPWSDGNIGVVGCSYLGGTTWHVATMAPPHLKAIAPGCTDFDKYGFVSRGGITAQFNTRPENPGQDYGQGVLPVDADVDGKLAAEAIAGHAAGTPMAELWRGMPFRDDVSPLLGVPFWKEASVATYADAIERSGVGIFIWGNWKDEGSFEATLAFNNLRNPRKLWMGGWGHCEVGDFPMSLELLRFFDHFLKRVDNGWEREAPVYYYTVNASKGEEWSSANRWPVPEARSQALRLGEVLAPQGSDRFTVNYSPVCKEKVDAYFMMWPCVIDQHGAGYITPPLDSYLHILGHPVADLWISSTTPDADVFVYLEDIAADGKVTIITHGRLRATHRAEQKTAFRDYMALPYHRGNRADSKPLVPGQPALLKLDLLPTSTLIKSGHRLRLTIAGADPCQRSRNLTFNPAPTLTLHNDARHASALHLPTLSQPKFASKVGVAPSPTPPATAPVAGSARVQESAPPLAGALSLGSAPLQGTALVAGAPSQKSSVSAPSARSAFLPTSNSLPGAASLELPSAVRVVAASASSEAYGAASVKGAPGSVDLGAMGYVEEEFFVSGRANAYRYDERFEVSVARRDIPYTTRLLVRRPLDPKRFSGVVHLESAHPVQGGHLMWPAAHRYMLRRGDAYALLVTGEDSLTRGGAIAPERAALRAQLQQQGQLPLGAIAVLHKFDPQRYAPLSWPEDDAPRWDAFAQTGALLKSNTPGSPLAGLEVKRLYVEGWSFTGSLLRTFINEGFHDRARLADGKPVFDGYLIGISSSTFVSGVVALTTGTSTLPLGHPRRVTRSIDVPVIELMTENEAVTNTGPQVPENDTGIGRHRLYEVPGLSHGDGLVEPGSELTTRYQLTQRGIPVRSMDDRCPLERSDVPLAHLASAALANLDAWVTQGIAPPRANRMQLDPTRAVMRDVLGNARGGVRTAQLDVPLARYTEPGASAPQECQGPAGSFLKIRRQPLDRALLKKQYSAADVFAKRFEARVQQLVSDRWLLPEDAAIEIAAARERSGAEMGAQ